MRESELRCACATLGIQPPHVLEYADGSLAGVDEQDGAAQVMAVIHDLHPQVLLTWPPDGLSGHPDHIAVSRWTALALQRAVALGTEAPGALYHLAVPRSVAQALGLAHLHALPDDEITLTVDVASVWQQKLAAIRCHRSQMASSPILTAPEEKQRLFLGKEHFRRARVVHR
jgi:LmbE family N-acetylglucosaminyl deacetylase